MVVRFVYWIGFLLVILAQTPPSHSVKEVDDTTKLSKLCTWNPTEETFWIRNKSRLLFSSAEMFKKLLSIANSVDPDQTAPIRAVCSGSTLFASILISSVM